MTKRYTGDPTPSYLTSGHREHSGRSRYNGSIGAQVGSIDGPAAADYILRPEAAEECSGDETCALMVEADLEHEVPQCPGRYRDGMVGLAHAEGGWSDEPCVGSSAAVSCTSGG